MKNLMQTFGRAPAVAGMMIAVDIMLTAPDVTVILIPLSVAVSAAMFWPVRTLQIRLFGDEPDVATSKALFCSILTAIPTPLPAFLTAAGGAVGLIGWLSGGKKPTNHIAQEQEVKRVGAIPRVPVARGVCRGRV